MSFGVTKVNTKTHSLRPEGCDVTAAITHGSDRYVPGSCVLLSNKTQLDVRCRNSCPSMPRAESPPACVSAIYQELFVCQHCQLLLLFGDLQSRRQTPRASQSNARVRMRHTTTDTDQIPASLLAEQSLILIKVHRCCASQQPPVFLNHEKDRGSALISEILREYNHVPLHDHCFIYSCICLGYNAPNTSRSWHSGDAKNCFTA